MHGVFSWPPLRNYSCMYYVCNCNCNLRSCSRCVAKEGFSRPCVLPSSHLHDSVLCSQVADINWDGENELILGTYGKAGKPWCCALAPPPSIYYTAAQSWDGKCLPTLCTSLLASFRAGNSHLSAQQRYILSALVYFCCALSPIITG